MDEPTPIARGLYDRNTLAEYLSCSVDFADKLFREGIIPSSVPFGMKRGRRCTHEAVEAYIARSMKAAS